MNIKKKFTAAELTPGNYYRVVASFEDFDGKTYSVGESWKFLKKVFLPYNDGLSLFIESEGKEFQIQLQWRSESQAKIIEEFSDSVEEITNKS